ncbi:MAG: methionyl-tRNA formyltransferase [Coriobacteriales bacterium]|jgi:methionyl-tRNA formyltransferase|nr:methionyl-tRNA formyltransferase [Coriobacteriales bacterium]
MNIVFMGTPSFATSALKALAEDLEGRFSVELVFTRPDAASRRGKALLPSPVRAYAEKSAIPVLTPHSFYAVSRNPEPAPLFDTVGRRVVDAEWLARIAATAPDFIVVAAYGMILPGEVLKLPRYGCINIHASLLPRWRGAAPIQRAILAGDERLGVSIMRMEKRLDTGAYCAVGEVEALGKNARELTEELARLGAELLVESLPRIADGSATWVEQDEDGVTYADKIEKYEMALDPFDSAELNLRRVLASTSQAPARCVIADRTVAVLDARLGVGAEEIAGFEENGTDKGAVLATFIKGQLLLTTADGSLEVTSLKPDGGKEMSAAAFAAGAKGLRGDIQGLAVWHAVSRSAG